MKDRTERSTTTPNTIPNPTSFHVLVRPHDVEEVTESGIVLTNFDNQLDYEQNAACTGELLAVGPTAWKGYDDGEPWAKVGDIVHFKKHVAELIPDPANPGKKIFLLDDGNILGVYPDA